MVCGMEQERKEEVWEEQIRIFKQSLEEKNRSRNTIRSYLYAPRQFYRLYSEVTGLNLQQYKLYLIEHYNPRTVNVRICGMNSFLRCIGWAEDLIRQVKLFGQRYSEQGISDGDYEYLKVRLLADKQYFYYFLIRFMAATGARCSEVVQFTVEDVKTGYKNIYSKGDKVHRIYIPKLLQKDALKWLRQSGRQSGDIFVTHGGNRISASGIRKRMKKLARDYQLSEKVMHPHSFRHRFAKSFIEQCSDIALLSNLLGHESLETTRIYLRRSSSEQKAIINGVVDW